MNVKLTRRTAAIAVAVVILAGCLPTGIATYTLAKGLIEARIQAQMLACEIAKADRVDNARAWTEVEKSVGSRARDKNLPASERNRAGASAVIYGESANQLRIRLFECEPLIRNHDEIIDENALREAKGKL